MRLGKTIRYFYEHFNSVRNEKELWQAETVNLKVLCAYLFRVAPFSGTFSQRPLFDWEKVKAHQFSVPAVERKAIKFFQDEMPYVRKYKLSEVKAVDNDEVYKKDLDTVKRYSKDKFVAFQDINVYVLSKAFKRMKEHFSVHGCKVLSFSRAIDELPKDTSSCYPLYHKKNSQTAIDDAKVKIDKLMSDASAVEKLTLLNTQLVTVFHRFTMKLSRVKTGVSRNLKVRQVFGVPFCVSILECMLFGDALKKVCMKRYNDYFSYSLTRPEISEQVKSIKAEARAKNYFILCGDYKSIDSSIPPILISLSFLFLGSFYNYSELHQQLFYVYNVWILFTPILWMSRKVSWMNGGNVTGSYATSYINSFVTLLILSYSYLTLYDEYLEPSNVKILGDDFLLLIKTPEDKDRLCKIMTSFGLTLNETKSHVIYWDEDPNYLGFYWDNNFEPYNEDLWYLAKICFPERFLYVKGPERMVQRAASILYQIKGGGRLFDRVFLNRIRGLRSLIEQGIDPVIEYLDRAGSSYSFALPYSMLRSRGWRCF